jgi:pyruvyltransferase
MSIRTNALRVTARLSYEGLHAWESAVAKVRGNGFSAYWYRKELNFGDLITSALLKHYGFTPVFTRPSKARLAGAGSILEHLPNDFTGVILGSGFILETSSMSFPKATILALRGELSRQRVGAAQKLAFGDPGLLASEVMPRREQKKFTLGIVPHYLERSNSLFGQLIVRLGHDATLIDAQQEPLTVFAAIDQCEYILSSSLHGLVVADSLGIPNRWLASVNLWGGRFKFDDYYSGIGIRAEPAALTGGETLAELLALVQAKASERIQENKEALRGLWASLGQYR